MFTDHESLKYIFSQKELNIRQRRWLKFLKDYDFFLQYHPSKANMVEDALGRKSTGLLASLVMSVGRLIEKLSNLDLDLYFEEKRIIVVSHSYLRRFENCKGETLD